ncbi:MAG: glycine betaine ABC transporter substrate-binding protein [Bryobacteraceae bacterium]
MDRKKIRGLICILVSSALALAGCGKSRQPIVVGSKNFTEQVLLGEIISQHLEHRLGRKVTRRLDLGGTLLTYQALLNGQISLYPEYTGTIDAEILKETPVSDPAQVYERDRQEMLRRTHMVLLSPLGIDNSFVMVIPAALAKKDKVETLSQAAEANPGWKIGMGYEFAQRIDGIPALDRYHLPRAAAPRTMDLGLMYKAMDQGQVNMIAANATDGALLGHDWTALRDDKKVFGSYQACILVRQDILEQEPRLKPALDELSGRFSNDLMRKLNAEVDVEHKDIRQVAAEFLKQAGLD